MKRFIEWLRNGTLRTLVPTVLSIIAAVLAVRVQPGAPRILAPPHILAAGGIGQTPIVPQNWTVANWHLDPGNALGGASDGNDCQTNTTSCLTMQEINVHRLNCLGNPTACPRTRQNTKISVHSSQSGNSDPLNLNVGLENGSFFEIVCDLGASQQVQTGTLGTVTAKNRNTPQLLNAVLGAGLTAGQIIVNSTHSSRAFLYSLVSGTTWAISQPCVPQNLNSPSASCSEVDSWTAGDTYTVFTPISINVNSLNSNTIDYNGSLNSFILVDGCALFDPNAPGDIGVSEISLGAGVVIAESTINKSIMISQISNINSSLINNYFSGSAFAIRGGAPAGNHTASFNYLAGVYLKPIFSTGGRFDSDIIIATGATAITTAISAYGLVYIESGTTWSISSAFGSIDGSIAQPIVWGPGNLNIQGSSRMIYKNSASASFPLTGAIQINGQTTACSHSGANNPDVANCGITINTTNLAAAQGIAGFGNYAYSPGGASLVLNSNGQ